MKFGLGQLVTLVFADRTATIIACQPPSAYVVRTHDGATWHVGGDDLAAVPGASQRPPAAAALEHVFAKTILVIVAVAAITALVYFDIHSSVTDTSNAIGCRRPRTNE